MKNEDSRLPKLDFESLAPTQAPPFDVRLTLEVIQVRCRSFLRGGGSLDALAKSAQSPID